MLIGHQHQDFPARGRRAHASPSTASRRSNDLSFYVEENEIRVIIGPNGAGKTTVLDLICGKTQGHVRARSSFAARS